MAAWLEHERVSDPVVFAEKMLAFFAHVCPNEIRASAGYQSDGIATGVRINTEKGFNGHNCWVAGWVDWVMVIQIHMALK